jgi:hypothetical protein
MSILNSLIDCNPIIRCGNSIFSHLPLLQNICTYIDGLVCNNIPDSSKSLLFGVGAIAVTYKVLRFICTYYRMWKWVPAHIHNQNNLKPEKLKQKYGDCYAMISGCTEGIGLAFVIEFAKMGFGVVLVARNRDKLKRRIEQVETICPHFKHVEVIGDFRNVDDVKRVAQ